MTVPQLLRARSVAARAALVAVLLAAGVAGGAATAPARRAVLAGEITGQARVIDGDTLDVSGIRIRLHGIDAPEARQTCESAAGVVYLCGAEAAKTLREMIAGRPVRCVDRSRLADRYGRIIAVCYDDAGRDLNDAMVRAGQAVAYRRYSLDYVEAEDAARAARVGIWSGRFAMPAEWRQDRRGAR
jgi:endonuclease YncB( thermonuclease family)